MSHRFSPEHRARDQGPKTTGGEFEGFRGSTRFRRPQIELPRTKSRGAQGSKSRQRVPGEGCRQHPGTSTSLFRAKFWGLILLLVALHVALCVWFTISKPRKESSQRGEKDSESWLMVLTLVWVGAATFKSLSRSSFRDGA